MKTDEIVVLWEIPLSGGSVGASKEGTMTLSLKMQGTKILNQSF